MAKNKTKASSMAKSLEALIEYFDTHDLGDDWSTGRPRPARRYSG